MSEICVTRLVREDDLPMILSWRNHPNVRRYMLTQHEIGLVEHMRWFEKARIDHSRCLLLVQDQERAIGYVQFAQVCVGGIADWGFYADPEAPKGSGRKIGTAGLTHAFKELHLHKVNGQAFDFNQASIALHTHLGFKQEGRLREQQRVDDGYYDLMLFGLLAQEWAPSPELRHTP